ncbi:MAG: MotA/TolQ/ExbB proton channel family protein [Victivallales bacterium]|nr:MotA/TolQ/ExbB proton channel family protein [Victivallales bacterium]
MKRFFVMLFCLALLLGAAEEEAERRLKEEIQTAKQSLNQTLQANQLAKSKLLNDIQSIKLKQKEALAKKAKDEAEKNELDNQLLNAQQELQNWRGFLQRTEQLLQEFQASPTEQPTQEELFASLEKELLAIGKANVKEGTALDEKGIEHFGTFAVLGPSLFFRSKDGITCGPAVHRTNSLLPMVMTRLSSREQRELAKLFNYEDALPPTDISQGQGLYLRTTQETFFQHLAKGGPIMIPIALLGLLSLVFGLFKIIQLLLYVPSCMHLEMVDRMVAVALTGKEQEAEDLAKKLHPSFRAMALAALQNREEDEEHLEMRIYEASLASQSSLEHYLSILSVSASAAPLLGLLGTVTGMIHTFRLITMFGTGDAKLLSGGISEALVTTEAGLIVAIPALLIHVWCLRRVRRNVSLCKQAALCLLRLAKGSRR